MNKKDAERLFGDRPLRGWVESRRRKKELKETEQPGRQESSQRLGVPLDMEQMGN